MVSSFLSHFIYYDFIAVPQNLCCVFIVNFIQNFFGAQAFEKVAMPAVKIISAI